MSSNVYRRCGCRDENGKQFGAHCPELKSDGKHGSWAYLLSAGSDPRTKKRRQYRKAGFATRPAAVSALAKLRTELDTGTYTEPSKLILADYAPQVLERRRDTGNGLKPATVAIYRRNMTNDICPSRLGEMKLTDIRRSHVNAWVAGLIEAKRGPSAIGSALATLHWILKAAVRDEIISANPASDIDKPAKPKHPVEFWEPEQVGEFLTRAGHHRLGALFELAVYTGLRRGEICGLHWADVDLDGREIVVRRNRTTINGRIVEDTTKTRSSRRPQALSGVAAGALLAWQLRQGLEREAAQEAWQTEGHVFTMEDGRALDPAYVSRLFQVIRLEGTPLPYLTFHGLRHSYASLAIAAGADLSTVSKTMGHSSITITADTYAHMFRSVGRQAVDGVAALVAHTLHSQPVVNG